LGVVPNVLAAAAVIAVMGYAGIPLDMMTITIAAISVGIGVDDAIHYLHRFREEREKGSDVRLSVAWSHATIGRAMYFTSLTIIVGFSVLTLSNFVPTILFGVLTAVAMVLALVANLLVLPSLLVLFLGAPRRDLPLS
jgi:predicted RND superfamily exporter protein